MTDIAKHWIRMALPRHFCWTRFGTEAGERISQILARKEVERVVNGGKFLWGIGNALGPSMRQLIRLEVESVVVFSPIRTRPRTQDVAPDQILMWSAGRTLDDQHYEIPAGSIVTSRSKSGGRGSCHYALVCASSSGLRIDLEGESVAVRRLRNLLTDRPLGASQVTAIVRQADYDRSPSPLTSPAAMRAQLVYPFLIKMLGPVPVPNDHCGQVAI